MTKKSIDKAANISWKTTTGAIIGMIALVFVQLDAKFDADPETVANWASVVAAAPVAFALLFARDNDVSSEKAGAK